MLVLTRNIGQSIIINDNIVITINSVNNRGRQVSIGIEAPKDITIYREEIQIKIDMERDYWMTPAEAKAYGLIDDVITKA